MEAVPAQLTEPGRQDRSGSAPTRETNGITSRIVLLYVEDKGGRAAVEQVLHRAGLEGREEELLDENLWFSYDEKIALFAAAAEVLDDPDVMQHVGDVVLDLNVGQGLKVALRALGSPRLVYQNIVRANAKFSASHTMDLLELGRDHARVRYRDRTDARRYHPLDCQYNRGLLPCIPGLFGLPAAQLSHPVCGCEGAEACIYELRWDEHRNAVRSLLGAIALGAALTLAAFILHRAWVPLAAGILGALVLLSVGRTLARRVGRWRRLEGELQEQSESAERLNASLQDLVSELRLEDVLQKVTRNAQAAVGGKEFAVLIDGGDGPRVESSTGLPGTVTRQLEQWADGLARDLRESMTVEDVSLDPVLSPLSGEPAMPVGSLCVTPLVFRGERLGLLAALAPQARTFLPRDIDLIQSYAAQAAIALANARLYKAQEQLASRDSLTGLLNHREFHETLEREVERCRRYGGKFSLVLFDLDEFKAVNDAYGHAAGDQVLTRVADAISGGSRASDTAFRIGGDELALVLPNTDGGEAQVAAERARDAVAALPGDLDLSWGIAVWSGAGETKNAIIQRADGALYAMKRRAAKKSPF